MVSIYNEGDIFKVEDKEYRLRHINKFKTCWLEPVVAKHGNNIITGGLNRIFSYEELSQLELVAE